MQKKDFDNSTNVYLFITDYPRLGYFAGPISMALFHCALLFNRSVRFYKLMGCGKNGSFDIQPDLNKWALLVFENNHDNEITGTNRCNQSIPGRIIRGWWRMWSGQTKVFCLKPFTGHGSWDGFNYVKATDGDIEVSGKVAVLTRATIRLSKLSRFWKYVPSAAIQVNKQRGLQFTVGIGEIPLIKQATFSIWDSIESIRQYAYHQATHKEIVRLTKKEKWYSEEMFIRFQVIDEHIMKN